MTIIVDYLDNFRNGSIWLMFNYSVAFSVHHPTHILQISSAIKGIFCSRQYFRANEPWTWIDRVVEVFSSCRWFESHLRENILFLFRNMSLFHKYLVCIYVLHPLSPSLVYMTDVSDVSSFCVILSVQANIRFIHSLTRGDFFHLTFSPALLRKATNSCCTSATL